MTKLIKTWVFCLSAIVLAVVPSLYAQTTDDSGQAGLEPVSPGPLNPTNALVDVVFTPITPCRIINTTVSGGPIAAGSTRNFVVAGTTGFAAQGGTPALRNPRGPAVAAVINYVAVNPAGAGTSGSRPSARRSPGQRHQLRGGARLNIANGVATKLCSPGASCRFDITIQASSSTTGLVADVFGYYAGVTCQAGTVKVLGQCFETALRAGDDLRGGVGCLPGGTRGPQAGWRPRWSSTRCAAAIRLRWMPRASGSDSFNVSVCRRQWNPRDQRRSPQPGGCDQLASVPMRVPAVAVSDEPKVKAELAQFGAATTIQP